MSSFIFKKNNILTFSKFTSFSLIYTMTNRNSNIIINLEKLLLNEVYTI